MIAELENLYAEKKNNEFPGFLVRKSQNAEKPFSLKQLVEEFKNSCDAPQSTGYWLMRAHKFRSTIHQSEKYDVETKVKLSFALSAKCDEEFLKELRKNAFVTVDGHNRITEYKTKSLELHGVHSKLVTLSVEENRILQYLKGLCMEKGLPLTESWFLKEGEPEDDDKENQPPEAEFFSKISNDSRVEETRRGNEEIFHVDQQEYSLSVEAPDRKKRRGSCPEGSYVAAKSSLKVKEEEKVLKRSKSFPEIKIEEIPLPVREKILTRKVFQSLASFIGCFAMIDLSGIKNDIEKSRERIPPLLKTSVSTILIGLRKGERIISESARRYIDDESISLKLVLLQLRRFVSSFGLPELNGFEKYLSEKSDKLSLIHQGVPIRKLKQFIETTLRIVWSDMELI